MKCILAGVHDVVLSSACKDAFGLVIQQSGGALLISWISSELTEWKILFLKKLECIFLEMMDDHIELVFDEI